ncbi:TetR/AcrR family transcriptional regulator [Pendulispora rubella]|uniref:TetR/AcrR family transcriptional regulator n=1 Tax=Pendulispora rubella TaxID=2741070 RepID=A0ABZ2KZE2_9BACT
MTKRVSLPIQGRPEPIAERADAARNRVRILNATRKLLAKRPIEAIGMDDVARAAGVGKGTVFRRFVDRSTLCLALLDENERELQENVLADFGLPKEATAYERLTVFLDALFAFHADNAHLLGEAESYSRTDRFKAPVYAWRVRELVRRIRRAADAGSIQPANIGITAELILAGLGAQLLLRQMEVAGGRDALHELVFGVWKRLLNCQ